MVPICLLMCRYNGGSDRFGGSAAAAPMPSGPERYITGHKATPHKLHLPMLSYLFRKPVLCGMSC